MRITNSMIYGGAMNNIVRNARHLNNLVTQIETGKKTQRPSDDPLIASRALRYRTILSEAEQFIRNAEQSMSWMEVSEAALNSILTGDSAKPSPMSEIYTRLLQAADGTRELADVRAIVAELEQYFEQMYSVDMNQTYLGRYVFSGYHTNEPAVLRTDQPAERSFIIQQSFKASDIERTQAFYRPSLTELPKPVDANILKLPYTNVDFDFDSSGIATAPPVGITLADGTAFHIITVDSTMENAYSPTDYIGGLPVIHHVHDTGELVISDAISDLIRDSGGIDVTYEKNNFKTGELNPIVYFASTEITDGEAHHYDTAGQNIQMEISPSSHITTNSHARDILTANLYADLRRLFDFANTLIASDPNKVEEDVLARGGTLAEFLSDEQAMFKSIMHDRVNNMLKSIMEHASVAQREHTSLGSRMSRLETVWFRLEEDEIAYTELLSKNEDADLTNAIRRKEDSEIAFNKALNAIARTSQLALSDFINR
ncbi:MAG: hypothetical protein FWG87_06205 [Defluviitaleaceae bacterium]|nr:hypothetical protein [Defluviitaleaceae bacterium]